MPGRPDADVENQDLKGTASGTWTGLYTGRPNAGSEFGALHNADQSSPEAFTAR
jgi:hypothetical protein